MGSILIPMMETKGFNKGMKCEGLMMNDIIIQEGDVIHYPELLN